MKMCEIHFCKIMGNKKIREYDMKQVSKMLEYASRTNDDGFGLFNQEKIYKNENAYDIVKNEKIIMKHFLTKTKSDFLIAHNRLMTKGEVSKRNSHPFDNERFTWCHNGHISNFDELCEENNFKKLKVDSEIIGYLLLKKCQDKEDISEDLKNTLNSLSGSFSTFIYDKKMDKIYYVKHNADFTFRLIKNKHTIIIGSTDYENLQNTYRLNKKVLLGFKLPIYKIVSELVPKEDMVYEIGENGLVELFKVNPKEVVRTTKYNVDGHSYQYRQILKDDDEDSHYLGYSKSSVGSVKLEDMCLKELEVEVYNSLGSRVWIKEKENGRFKMYCSNATETLLNESIGFTPKDVTKEELLGFIEDLNFELGGSADGCVITETDFRNKNKDLMYGGY